MLDHDARVPVHRQIETSIRDSIRAGRLPRGSPLPLSRVLAADLGISRGVVEAYQQLTAEGYLVGSGVPQLRTAIVGYLNRVRGTLPQPSFVHDGS